ncbi:hypothetical protein D3C87_1315040 [compost metagenome]
MFEVYGSKHSLLPKICEVDAVGIGATNKELYTPSLTTFLRNASQSQRPLSGVTFHKSNWNLPFDNGEPLNVW